MFAKKMLFAKPSDEVKFFTKKLYILKSPRPGHCEYGKILAKF